MKKNKLNKIEVVTLNDFKVELKKILNTTKIANFNIEIGIPKWSIYTPINVEGTYNDYKFKGIIKDICKWHEYKSYYVDIRDLYNEILNYQGENLNIDFIYELTENGNFEFDLPTDEYDFSKLKWEKNTPDEIKFDFEEDDFEEFCEGYDEGNPIVPKIKYFKIVLAILEDNSCTELIWENTKK
jgi:hypothetical protein